VAQDGYDALMRGEHMVVSGFKNKVKVALSNVLSDKAVAKKTHKEHSETDEKNSGATSLFKFIFLF
jgi:hypothetical protein